MISLVHSTSGIIKECPTGYSWTTCFFGFFPALFRGDLKWDAIQLLVSLAIGVPTAGIGGGFVGPVFGFFYNKLYIKDMIAKGYGPADDYSAQWCQDNGILMRKI